MPADSMTKAMKSRAIGVRGHIATITTHAAKKLAAEITHEINRHCGGRWIAPVRLQIANMHPAETSGVRVAQKMVCHPKRIATPTTGPTNTNGAA